MNLISRREKFQKIDEQKFNNFFYYSQSLMNRVRHSELIEPYAKFYNEMKESSTQKRLPRYDYLYRMFDDALYAGRDRSKRIVFDWLTPEEQAKAMAEEILPIESIEFPRNLLY